MIISHKHRFVFVKTNKTAGSSMEALLETYLQPGDMMTLRSELKSDQSKVQSLQERGIQILTPESNFNPHSPLITAHKAFPDSTNYFSFGVLRNPFKRAISSFRWNSGKRIERILKQSLPSDELEKRLQRTFLQYLMSGRHNLNTRGRNLLQSISPDGCAWCVDRIHRLEALGELEKALESHTGLKINCSAMPRLKSGTIPLPKQINLFTSQVIKWISMQHQWELDTLGYQIPAAANNNSSEASGQKV